MKRTLLAAALCLVTALVAACGYSTRSLISEKHRTIAVPVFRNSTFRHDLEWEVTRAVVDEIQARTDLEVVPPDADPDLVLDGVLVDVDDETLSRQKFQRPRESVVFVTAEVTVRSPRTGEVLVPKRKVTERESYAPAVREDIRTAREQAVRSLAERVVRRLEEAW